MPRGAQLALLPDALASTPTTGRAPAAVPARTVSIEELSDRARAYFEDARSPRTRRAYAGDWKRFAAWCCEQGRAPYPATPETIALYLTHLAELGRKRSTLVRARAAIGVRPTCVRIVTVSGLRAK